MVFLSQYAMVEGVGETEEIIQGDERENCQWNDDFPPVLLSHGDDFGTTWYSSTFTSDGRETTMLQSYINSVSIVDTWSLSSDWEDEWYYSAFGSIHPIMQF